MGNKIMHGQYVKSEDRQLIGEEDTLLWLSSGELKGEYDSEIIAAQDRALQTKYHAIKIFTYLLTYSMEQSPS
jgi:hypothetical protein